MRAPEGKLAMKAIVLKEFGDPENLSLDDLPIPSVEPGAVLIRAVAASANPVDVSISKGTPFSPVLPAALGCDVAGVVESGGTASLGLRLATKCSAALAVSAARAGPWQNTCWPTPNYWRANHVCCPCERRRHCRSSRSPHMKE